jgi:hypothetical protein
VVHLTVEFVELLEFQHSIGLYGIWSLFVLLSGGEAWRVGCGGVKRGELGLKPGCSYPLMTDQLHDSFVTTVHSIKTYDPKHTYDIYSWYQPQSVFPESDIELSIFENLKCEERPLRVLDVCCGKASDTRFMTNKQVTTIDWNSDSVIGSDRHYKSDWRSVVFAPEEQFDVIVIDADRHINGEEIEIYNRFLPFLTDRHIICFKCITCIDMFGSSIFTHILDKHFIQPGTIIDWFGIGGQIPTDTRISKFLSEKSIFRNGWVYASKTVTAMDYRVGLTDDWSAYIKRHLTMTVNDTISFFKMAE